MQKYDLIYVKTGPAKDMIGQITSLSKDWCKINLLARDKAQIYTKGNQLAHSLFTQSRTPNYQLYPYILENLDINDWIGSLEEVYLYNIGPSGTFTYKNNHSYFIINDLIDIQTSLCCDNINPDVLPLVSPISDFYTKGELIYLAGDKKQNLRKTEDGFETDDTNWDKGLSLL